MLLDYIADEREEIRDDDGDNDADEVDKEDLSTGRPDASAPARVCIRRAHHHMHVNTALIRAELARPSAKPARADATCAAMCSLSSSAQGDRTMTHGASYSSDANWPVRALASSPSISAHARSTCEVS